MIVVYRLEYLRSTVFHHPLQRLLVWYHRKQCSSTSRQNVFIQVSELKFEKMLITHLKQHVWPTTVVYGWPPIYIKWVFSKFYGWAKHDYYILLTLLNICILYFSIEPFNYCSKGRKTRRKSNSNLLYTFFSQIYLRVVMKSCLNYFPYINKPKMFFLLYMNFYINAYIRIFSTKGKKLDKLFEM